MDTFSGIHLSVLFTLILCTSEISGTLFLQPTTKEHGFFTGDSFFVTCFTTDQNLDSVTWYDADNAPIRGTEGRVHTQVSGGNEKGLRLVFTSFEKEDGGKYSCRDETSSAEVQITVYRSVNFGDTPHEHHAAEGDEATILCNAKSDPKPLVNWSFKTKNKAIQTNEKYKVMENHNLLIKNLERSDAGEYVCKAYVITSHNTQVKDFNIELHVQYKPEIVGDHESTVYATIGKTKELVCNISSEPKPVFQWLNNDMIINNGTDEDDILIFNSVNSSILQVPVDTESRFDKYICRGINPLGQQEVIIDLKEGETPFVPELFVTGEDQGIVKLSLRANQGDSQKHEELKITGFKVEYVLSSESWDSAISEEFVVGGPYELRNMSYNSDYLLRAAARNVAGYSNFSEGVAYRTHTLETAAVIDDGTTLAASTMLLLALIGLVFIY